MIMVHGRKDFSFHHAGLCGNIVRDGLDGVFKLPIYRFLQLLMTRNMRTCSLKEMVKAKVRERLT